MIEKSEKMLRGRSKDTLVYGSALNLLLFSPTYKDSLTKKFRAILKSDKHRTYIFTVSISALRADIQKLEEVADNLLFTEGSPEKGLYIYVERLKNKKFNRGKVKVQISREILGEIKEIAGKNRARIIPKLRKI